MQAFSTLFTLLYLYSFYPHNKYNENNVKAMTTQDYYKFMIHISLVAASLCSSHSRNHQEKESPLWFWEQLE